MTENELGQLIMEMSDIKIMKKRRIAFIWSGGTVIVDKHGHHFSRVYTESYCKRFFNVAEEAVFFTKIVIVEDADGLTPMDMMDIQYRECINPMSLNGIFHMKDNYRELENVLINCDMAVITIPSMFIAHKAQEICSRNNIPYLLQLGGCAWDTMWNHGIMGKVLALPAFLSTRRCVRVAPAVSYVTQKFLQKRYPTKGTSIGCSNAEIDFVSEDVLDKRIEKIDKLKDRVIIGTAAAVDVKYKGQQYIIEALRKMKFEKTEYYYQIVGGGDQDYLQGLVHKYGLEDRVQLLGSLKHEEVFRWLDNIDIYAQPSRTEGLPRAVIEAMSRGVPCIGANSGGIPELIDEEFMFSNGKTEVDDICKILKNMDKEKMKLSASTNFTNAKEYNADILRNRRKDFYMKVLSRSNQGAH